MKTTATDRRLPPDRMDFSPNVRIDLDALRHNLGVVRSAAPGRRVMAVIKADAYGHGAVPVARALEGADALAVARLDEGLRLREAGIHTPVVVLEGCQDGRELAEAVARQLGLVVHREEQLAELEQLRPANVASCWLKVDTGMHRLGVSPDTALEAHARLTRVLGKPPGLMTHLANADDPADPATAVQLARLAPLCEALDVPVSVANSAGILAAPDSHADWVRPGLMLYGSSPILGHTAADHGLRPVMTLTARLIAVHDLKAGDAVGYGGTWRCPADRRVGVVGIGYGDGYPREVSGAQVLLNGAPVPVVGRVSMDMLTVDLSDQPGARVGDRVILWGDGLPAEQVAAAAGTIPYTLFCGVKSRVRYDYGVARTVREASA